MFYFFSRKPLGYVRKRHAGCTRLVAAISEVFLNISLLPGYFRSIQKKSVGRGGFMPDPAHRHVYIYI